MTAVQLFDHKGDDAPHLYTKILSCAGMLGGGAFKQAMRFAGENQSPVWHYVVAFDSPYEQDTSRHYAWHTAELPLEMRIVRYPEESDALSRKISAVWAAFIRNMDPSLSNRHGPPSTRWRESSWSSTRRGIWRAIRTGKSARPSNRQRADAPRVDIP